MVESPSVSRLINARAQEHMYEQVADALDLSENCQDTSSYSLNPMAEVGQVLGMDRQDVVVGCNDQNKETTKHDQPVHDGMLSIECHNGLISFIWWHCFIVYCSQQQQISTCMFQEK